MIIPGEMPRAKRSYEDWCELEALPGEIEALLMEKLERWDTLEGKARATAS